MRDRTVEFFLSAFLFVLFVLLCLFREKLTAFSIVMVIAFSVLTVLIALLAFDVGYESRMTLVQEMRPVPELKLNKKL